MRIANATFTLLLAASGVAAAQPVGDPEAPQPQPQPQPPVTTTTTTTTAPATQPPPMPMVREHREHHEPQDEAPARPTEFSLGIGLGYVMPTSLEIPNTTSVRFRLPTGLTFEPQIILAHTSQDQDTGMAVTQGTTEIGIGTVIRYPLMARGKVDLELLGSILIDNSDIDPPGDSNSTTITNVSVCYGVAVGAWLSRHWQISLSASNPVISYTKNRQEQGPDTVTVDSTTTVGAVFDPRVTLMIHLYN